MNKTVSSLLALALVLALAGSAHADIVTGLVGHYTFDAGNANDTAPAPPNNGANVGSPTYPVDADPFRSTVVGVSDNNYVQIPNDPIIPVGGAARTFAIWAKIDSYEDNAGIFHHGNTSNQQDFSLELTNTGGKLTFNGWNADFDFTFPGDPNGWHQFVVAHEGTNITRVYVDGVERGSRTSGANLNTAANNIRLGGQRLNNSAAQLNGQLDDFRIYDRALDLADVGELYTATSGIVLPPPPAPPTWTFDEPTGPDEQGWVDALTSTVDNTHFAAIDTDEFDGRDPQSGVGWLAPRTGIGSGWNARDGNNTPLVKRSPSFVLGDVGDLTCWMQGGMSGGAAPGNFSGLGGTGFLGVALRDDSNGDYLLAKGRPLTNNDGYEQVTFTQAELAAHVGKTVTLDLIDDKNGGWGWGGMDTVTLPTHSQSGIIPEPMTMLAVGLGISGLGGYIRKRRRA